MRDSGLDRNGLVLSNRALGYERHFGPNYTPGPYLDLSHIFFAGAMYSTAEDLFRWNQAMSSDVVLPKETRDQLFHPDLANWGYGWFITRISPGQPGAGSTLAEMRGDLPGNFFCSIARFPDQDALIIVLRNGYGSSERLETNLQAVLFDQNPRLPLRKPADILVALSALLRAGSTVTSSLLSSLPVCPACCSSAGDGVCGARCSPHRPKLYILFSASSVA